MGNIEEHLLAHRLHTETGCWLWTMSCQSKGYGQTFHEGKMWLVHRLAAVLWNGFDPVSGLQILHHCDTPPCFNPAHLFVGTPAENSADMVSKGRAKNKPRKKIDPAAAARAFQLVEDGVSMRAAAREIGVSHTFVQDLMRHRNSL